MSALQNLAAAVGADGFWRRTSAMLLKEFLQLRRDRITFATMITIPLLQLVLFGYAINTLSLIHICREQREIAHDRHAEHQHAGADDQRCLHKANQHIGRDLAEHDLERRDRHGEQALHGAALDLARHRQRREDQHGHCLLYTSRCV